MSTLHRRCALLLVLLASPVAARAQQQPVQPADTAAPTVSGRGAFLRSLVLPGWGQAYVGAPGRGSIYFAMEAGSLWMLYKTHRELREARDFQEWQRSIGEIDQDDKLGIVNGREEQFEDWAFLSGFILLFAGADAYVAAQLADFDRVIGVRPAPGGGVELEARVPLPPRR